MLTKDELDAMDVGQIVVDRDGDEWVKRPAGGWGHDGSIWPSMSVANYGVRRKETGLTREELVAMNEGQIVVDEDGDEWRKDDAGFWRARGGGMCSSSIMAAGVVVRRETHVEQPMPTESSGPSMHTLAVAEVWKRQEIGQERYGQPLQAMNGRDAVRDTIEELADGLAYALQIREERRLLREELDALYDSLVEANSSHMGRLGDILDRYFPEGS